MTENPHYVVDAGGHHVALQADFVICTVLLLQIGAQ